MVDRVFVLGCLMVCAGVPARANAIIAREESTPVTRIPCSTRRRAKRSRGLLRFRRYDAPLEAGWLKDQLNKECSPDELDGLRDFTNSSNVDRLYELGYDAAKTQIRADHLPDHFKVEAGASQSR